MKNCIEKFIGQVITSLVMFQNLNTLFHILVIIGWPDGRRMDQESIFCKARVAAQGLETLRQEHYRMIETLKAHPLSSQPG